MTRRTFTRAAAVGVAALTSNPMQKLNVQSLGSAGGGRLVSLTPVSVGGGSSLRFDVPAQFSFEILSVFAEVVANAANPTRRAFLSASYKTITMWEAYTSSAATAGAVAAVTFAQLGAATAVFATNIQVALPKNLLPPESSAHVSLIGNAGNDAWTSAVMWGLAYPLE